LKKKECPSCAMEINANEKVCPICHYEFPEESKSFKMIVIVLILLFIVFILNIIL